MGIWMGIFSQHSNGPSVDWLFDRDLTTKIWNITMTIHGDSIDKWGFLSGDPPSHHRLPKSWSSMTTGWFRGAPMTWETSVYRWTCKQLVINNGCFSTSKMVSHYQRITKNNSLSFCWEYLLTFCQKYLGFTDGFTTGKPKLNWFKWSNYIWLNFFEVTKRHNSGHHTLIRIMIWLAGWWCNNHLEKYEFVNGKDDIPYIIENNPNVWNHQPVYIYMWFSANLIPESAG
jgi:hypothetical protein